jgi:hypothetical protein
MSGETTSTGSKKEDAMKKVIGDVILVVFALVQGTRRKL